MKSSSQGFSLVEILIVLGVISVIAVGAFLIYPRVSQASQAKEVADKVKLVHASIMDGMHGRSLYGATSAALVSAGMAEPEDFQSPWGVVNFHPTRDGHGCSAAAGCNGFSLSFANVPTYACVSLVQSTAMTSHKVRVQGTANHILKGSAPEGSPPGTPHVVYNPGDVPAACADGDTVTVYLDMVVG